MFDLSAIIGRLEVIQRIYVKMKNAPYRAIFRGIRTTTWTRTNTILTLLTIWTYHVGTAIAGASKSNNDEFLLLTGC